jgi:glycosyltransferase involved in cell wall biosynthesis
MIKIGVISYNLTGKFLYRQELPYEYIDRHIPGFGAKIYKGYTMSDAFATDVVRANDVIVLVGAIIGYPAAYPNIMKAAKERGKVVIYDIDDLDWEIPPENPVYSTFKRFNLEESTKEAMRGATVVTVPSKRMANAVKEFNYNVEIFPNAIDYDHYFWNLPKKDDGHIRIGWIGGSSHLYDIKKIEGLGKWIIERFDNTKFVLGGYDTRIEGPVVDRIKQLNWNDGEGIVWYHYKKILFGDNVDWNRIEIIPTHVIHTYPKIFKDIDILIAPLISNKFNNVKSDLKAMEASARKIPIIASDVGPYSDSITSSINGFLVRVDSDWKRYLKMLIEDSELRKRMGQKLYEDMKKTHNIELQATRRAEMIRKLVKDNLIMRQEFDFNYGRFLRRG